MRYTVGGKEYELRFDVHTMELIQEEYGDISEAVELFRKNGKSIRQVKKMFKVMANSGQELLGRPEDVTGDEISRLTLKGLDTLSGVMNAVLEESLHSETTGGNEADDEKHDLVLEAIEADAKNG